ncbi:hypothetical protein ACP70R_041293 [Stipagrostis hirtigluma subsp. patula]
MRLRAGESFPVRGEPRPRLVVGRRKAAAPASPGAPKKAKASGSSAPASASASAVESGSRAQPESSASASAAAAAEGVTVQDTGALDCGVCRLPLKPPIFQCKWGHVVCSPCWDNRKATGRCHECGVAIQGNSRCYAMERLVESIHVPCPNAAYGCAARSVYYDLQGHLQECPHARCFCPGNGCGFIGSVTMLVDHFAGVHGWPCDTEVMVGDDKAYNVCLDDGFNFLLADCAVDSTQCLFLLNVSWQPQGRAIAVLHIDPHAAALEEMRFKLIYSRQACDDSSPREDDRFINYHQRSTFRVKGTDLSNGLPSFDDSVQFVVPNSMLGDDDEDTIEVGVRIFFS